MSSIKLTNCNPNAFCLDDLIFQYFSPYDNEHFLNMSSSKFRKFLAYLEEYRLSLRDHLNISKEFTFGLELEFINAILKRIQYDLEQLHLNDFWESDIDSPDLGVLEVKSPVLVNRYVDWKNLQMVCSTISKYASINEFCGGHIHIGTHALGVEFNDWLNFLLFWSTYENIIFRFCYGIRDNARDSIRTYAEPLKFYFENIYLAIRQRMDIQELLTLVDGKRNQAVNFNNVSLDYATFYNFGNTIEFRHPNGTLDPVIWQNNVNMLFHILSYVRSDKFDKERILKRQQLCKNITFRDYENIYLEQALEFCDLIFSCNLDKIYFMKQYLKPNGKNYTRMKIR